MAEVALKIKVGNRVYPLTVDETEQPRVLAAAEKVNQNVQKLKETYALNDWVDLLAMTAFEFANHTPEQSNTSSADGELFEKSLIEMEKKLNDFLTFDKQNVL